MVTTDISKFGLLERKEARELLAVYGTDKDITKFLGDDIHIYFNTDSGYVFLTDEDYNTAMINLNGELEDFIVCPACGNEGLLQNFLDDPNECCEQYHADIMSE